MSLQRELNTHVKPVDEVVTYLDGSHQQIAYLDLGSAELRVMNDAGKAILVITTSSGQAACIPADLFAQ